MIKICDSQKNHQNIRACLRCDKRIGLKCGHKIIAFKIPFVPQMSGKPCSSLERQWVPHLYQNWPLGMRKPRAMELTVLVRCPPVQRRGGGRKSGGILLIGRFGWRPLQISGSEAKLKHKGTLVQCTPRCKTKSAVPPVVCVGHLPIFLTICEKW